jgi:putative membrane protein
VPNDLPDPHGPDDRRPVGRSPEHLDDAGDASAAGDLEDVDELALTDDGEAPLEEVVADRPVEAVAPLGPLGIAGSAVVGFGMGAADVVPGFSGGTVALVAGIYERLVANVRQGARGLALLLRGRPLDALRALAAIEWWFVAALLAGILTAVFTLASALSTLLDEEPVAMSAVFLGLVLGASIVASRELRDPSAFHPLIGVAVAAVTFWGLGFTTGAMDDPSLLVMFGAGAVAICAMILPGVSGSFLLLLLGVYGAVIGAVDDRDLLVLGVFALGCVVGLASFSTLLNFLLRRFHDLVLAALIGLMVGSARVLWPWPAATGVGDPTLGAPDGDQVFLAAALALAAFAVVWMLGLAAAAVQRRRHREPAEP